MNLYAIKGDTGEIYIRIDVTSAEVKGSGEIRSIRIPLMKFLELEEKLDDVVFEGNNSIRTKHLNRVVPLMGKEELHDLLFGISYKEGYPITRALSMKVELEITRRIETSSPLTYEDILELMSRTMGTGKNWSESTWMGTLSDKLKTDEKPVPSDAVKLCSIRENSLI